MRAVYGQYTIPPCTVKTDRGLGNEVIECETVPGVGKDMGWQIVVEVGEKTTRSTTTSVSLMSYKAPAVAAIRDASALRTSGMEEVRIDGQNFGPPDNNPITVFYSNRLGNDYYATECQTVAKTPMQNVEITCKLCGCRI